MILETRIPDFGGRKFTEQELMPDGNCKYHGDYFGDECDSCAWHRQRQEKILKHNSEAMGLAPKYHRRALTDWIQENDGQKRALVYANKFLAGDITSLLLVGDVSSGDGGGFGNGKTTLAAMLLWEFVKKGHEPGHYCLANGIAREFADCMNKNNTISRNDLVKKYTAKSFLVIDELAAGAVSAAECKFLSDIVSERLDYQRQTILISNMSIDYLSGRVLHKRVIDRLREDMAQVVFNWPSSRGVR